MKIFKRFFIVLSVLLFGLSLSACTDKTVDEDPIIIDDESLFEFVIPEGDIAVDDSAALDLLAGITALDDDGKNILDDVVITHQIPVDANNVPTTSGTYSVEFKLVLDGKEHIITRNVVVTVEEEVVVVEDPTIIVNGDFEGTETGLFTKSDFEGGASTLAIVEEDSNHLLELDITAVSFNQASPRLEYLGFELENGKFYELSFDAKSSVERVAHIQVGEVILPAAAPWFKAASSTTSYATFTTEMQSYTWSFQASSTVSGADLANVSLLFEFGTMFNGGPSDAATVLFDNVVIEEVTALTGDTVAPSIIGPSETYFYVGDTYNPLPLVSGYDNTDTVPTFTVLDSESTLPPLDADGKFTTTGTYTIRYQAEDAAGNTSTFDWSFEIRELDPVVNGFNVSSVASGGTEDLVDTNVAYIWSQTDDAEFSYDLETRALTLKTYQDKDSDEWYATQIFIKPVNTVERSFHYVISFDIESDVAGTIQVSDVAFDIEVGTNHIAYELYIGANTYKKVSIQLGVNSGLRREQTNIGPATVVITNLALTDYTDLPDTTNPTISMQDTRQYFVGEEFVELTSLIKAYDKNRIESTEIITELSTLPIVDENGVLTTAGEYTIYYRVTDTSGNSIDYAYPLVIKDALVNHNGWGITDMVFGESWAVDDPSIAFIWNDQGWVSSNVTVSHSVTDFDVTVTSDQAKDATWFSTQVFAHSLRVTESGKYVLSYDIVSDVAGKITINTVQHDIIAGTNHFEYDVTVVNGDYESLSIQFGAEGVGTVGPFTATIANLSLVPSSDDPNLWSGNAMTTEMVDGDCVVNYGPVSDPFWDTNAQLPFYDLTEDTQAIAFTFTGTAGNTYMFKFESNIDTLNRSTQVLANGEEQTVLIDVRSLTDIQRVRFEKFVMFDITPGSSGTITIHSFEIVDSLKDFYGTDWIGFGMDMEVVGTSTELTYTNISSTWWGVSAQSLLEGFDGSKSAITFTFTGEAGHNYLFKIEGQGKSTESSVIATGDQQEFTLDISSLTEEQRNNIDTIVFFCKTEGASGTISIEGWEYVTE